MESLCSSTVERDTVNILISVRFTLRAVYLLPVAHASLDAAQKRAIYLYSLQTTTEYYKRVSLIG